MKPWSTIALAVLLTGGPVWARGETQTPPPAAEVKAIDALPAIATKPNFEQWQTADRLYTGGDRAAARAIYQTLKPPFPGVKGDPLPPGVSDLAQLDGGAAVYWRIANEGEAQNLRSKTLTALRLLVDNYPQFIPGSIRYSQALQAEGRGGEAILLLGAAVQRYSGEADLCQALIAAYEQQEQWLDGSIVARQFTVLNPQHPQTPQFQQKADQLFQRYQGDLKAKIRGNGIANILTGTLGYFLTGSLYGPFSALDTTMLLLQGENSLGAAIAHQVEQSEPMLEDPEVLAYVQEVGTKIAKLTGRELPYEFHVVMDGDLNAFALPGGKVFINAGAILKTRSEAELAGLLAHEIAHSALSHGFQMVTEGSLNANLGQFIPLGGTIAGLINLNYSREMETQADMVGTKILASSGYAADGLWNLAQALEQEEQQKNEPRPPGWLSTHPVTGDRVRYLQALLVQNQYDRYGYEGVERHRQIQQKVAVLLKAFQEKNPPSQTDGTASPQPPQK